MPDPPKPDNVARLVARAATAKTPVYPNWASSETGGVMPMTIVGRFENERARLGPDFTEADRQWRIKWIKDQALHPSEPRAVPEAKKIMFNPLRRFYMAPLDHLEENILKPRIGFHMAKMSRMIIGKGVMAYGFVLFVWYTAKYNHGTWERWSGWRVMFNRPVVLPGDAAYPLAEVRNTGEDYYDHGFKSRNVFRDTTKKW
ncbi:hypothetical protein HDE_08870 [Halotydeus destructor]|nr:hypothetical protein HDE_08870 [Halotydeus destructor]